MILSYVWTDVYIQGMESAAIDKITDWKVN